MKKLLILFIIAIKINSVHAQDYDTIPPYQKDSLHIPAFTVLKIDSTYGNDKMIPKDKPVIIIYFSPTCGHCQITADEFSKKMKDMKDFYFVWVTYNHTLAEVKGFAKNFNLQQFNNIIIGVLSDYELPSFYRIQYTPFMAVYNKEHHLIQTYQQGTEADNLIKLLKEQ
jgi:thioredoxin-related protein